MPRRTSLIAIAFAIASTGCQTPERALRYADAAAGDAVARKEACVRGRSVPFDVEPPRDRIRDQTIDPTTGLASRPIPLSFDLAGAMEIAAQNSRDYQTQKEALYRTALTLVNQRVGFSASPFLNLSADATRDGGEQSVSAGGELGVTRTFERGGNFLLSVGGDFLRFLTDPTSTTAASFLNLVVTLPLLRNADTNAALENLRQADRDVLYAVRDLERFKQTFAVRIETQYLRVLASARRVKNEERNLESLTEARRRNEAFAQAQRITEIEVDQARQDELRARNRVVLVRNSYQGLLDGFKNTLGIPIDLPLELDQKDLENLVPFVARPFQVDESNALARGLELRLDLQNVRDQIVDARRRIKVAENQLESDLTVGAAALPRSEQLKPFRVRFEDGRYTAGIDADFALDRRVESVNLRRAHIDLEQAVRSFESAGDQVKSEIRDAIRTIQAARESYEIQERAVAVAKRRVESVEEFRLRGDATTRDLLESQESLVNAENDLVTALVEYRITFLNFYRDAGALVVSPEGLNHETSDALLAIP